MGARRKERRGNRGAVPRLSAANLAAPRQLSWLVRFFGIFFRAVESRSGYP
jgi:hypothetical protein